MTEAWELAASEIRRYCKRLRQQWALGCLRKVKVKDQQIGRFYPERNPSRTGSGPRTGKYIAKVVIALLAGGGGGEERERVCVCF